MNPFITEEDPYVDIPNGTIIEVVGNNIYKVQDVTRKSYNVYSSLPRKRGDKVRVNKGQIVNIKSGNVTKTKIVSI